MLIVSSVLVYHFLVSGVLAKHIADQRNLFAQRLCCKRQSHFVYIGQGKATSKTIIKSTWKYDWLQVMCIFPMHSLNMKQMDNEVTHSFFLPDISGGPVSVDVGLCRSHCGSTTRTPHHAGQQEYAKHSSMLEFLKNKKVGGYSLLWPQGRAVTQKIILKRPRRLKRSTKWILHHFFESTTADYS